MAGSKGLALAATAAAAAAVAWRLKGYGIAVVGPAGGRSATSSDEIPFIMEWRIWSCIIATSDVEIVALTERRGAAVTPADSDAPFWAAPRPGRVSATKQPLVSKTVALPEWLATKRVCVMAYAFFVHRFDHMLVPSSKAVNWPVEKA